MTFAARETSRALGSPIEIYLFRFGPELGAYCAYTNHDSAITFGGTVFTPIPIDRGSISSSGSTDKSSIEITMSRSAVLIDRYKIRPPSSVTSVVIWRGHVGETEFVRVWSGRVLSVARRKAGEAVLTCEPRAVSGKRPGLRRRFGPGCPHVLYGDKCQASKSAATVTSTVVSVSGGLLTVASDWETTERKPKYVNGMVEWVTGEGFAERRGIMAVNTGSGQITLDGYATGLVEAMSVDIVLGCDHQMTGCALHANSKNYGGQPWIPLENPIGFRNQFY